MDYKERVARAKERMTELKEGIEIAENAVKSDRDRKMQEVDNKLYDLNVRLNQYDQKVIAEMNREIEEYNKACDALEADVKGDIAAAEENLRIVKEKQDSKLNSARLKAQMNVHAIKARRIERLENMDKAAWNSYIAYLLDYAEDCQTIAEAYALEAELAIYEAVAEIEEYEKAYGTAK